MSNINIIYNEQSQPLVVQKLRILGSDTVKLMAWKPQGTHNAGTLTRFSEFPGVEFGKIGTFRIKNIDKMPLGPNRSQLVNDFYSDQFVEAYRIISQSSFQVPTICQMKNGEVIYKEKS